MRKLLIVMVFIILCGFKSGPEKCSGVVTVRLVYSWTDTSYLYVDLDDKGGEKRVMFIGKNVPQINERITFNCKQIIK